MDKDQEARNEVTFTTLDHIDNITVPGDLFRNPANEYWALECLRQGMEFLYGQVGKAEEVVRQRLPSDVRFSGMGNLPFYGGLPIPLLTCSFHWYAVSACNYVRTVGAIANRNDPSRPLPQHYAKAVIPDVVAFRDKVAAHFAWSTINTRDNDAERLASVLPPISFDEDSFYVGGMCLSLRKGGKSSTSEAITPWSLCKVHQTLRERYWPQQHGN